MSAADLDTMMGIAADECSDDDQHARADRELERLRAVDRRVTAEGSARRWGTPQSKQCDHCGEGGRGHDFEPDWDAFATLLGAGDDESVFDAAHRVVTELRALKGGNL